MTGKRGALRLTTTLLLLLMVVIIINQTNLVSANLTTARDNEGYFETSNPELAPLTSNYPQNQELLRSGLVGTGILYTYVDPERTIEAEHTKYLKNYRVIFAQTYYFNITGITEYGENETIHVWASYVNNSKLQNIHVGQFTIKDAQVLFEWTIPSKDNIGSPIIFRYGKSNHHNWYIAKNEICLPCLPRLLFAIPEIPVGPLTAITALFSAVGMTLYIRKDKLDER